MMAAIMAGELVTVPSLHGTAPVGGLAQLQLRIS